MYCPRCSEINEDSAQFCSACGLDLVAYGKMWSDGGAQSDQAPVQGTTPGADQTQYGYRAPQYPSADRLGPRPHVPSHMGLAIVALLFGSLLLGIPAVIFASQVNSKLAVDDVAGAQESSRKAQM